MRRPLSFMVAPPGPWDDGLLSRAAPGWDIAEFPWQWVALLLQMCLDDAQLMAPSFLAASLKEPGTPGTEMGPNFHLIKIRGMLGRNLSRLTATTAKSTNVFVLLTTATGCLPRGRQEL